jgi:hypothetical protein
VAALALVTIHGVGHYCNAQGAKACIVTVTVAIIVAVDVLVAVTVTVAVAIAVTINVTVLYSCKMT